jgi:hypothetical protein
MVHPEFVCKKCSNKTVVETHYGLNRVRRIHAVAYRPDKDEKIVRYETQWYTKRPEYLVTYECERCALVLARSEEEFTSLFPAEAI